MSGVTGAADSQAGRGGPWLGRAPPPPPAGRAGRRLRIGGVPWNSRVGRTSGPGPPRARPHVSRGATAVSRRLYRALAASARRSCTGPGWGRPQSVLGSQGGLAGRPLPWPGSQLGGVALRQARCPVGPAALAIGVLSRPKPVLRTQACTGGGAREPVRLEGAWDHGAGPGRGRLAAPCSLGKLRRDNTQAAAPASLRPPYRDLVKGLVLSPLLLSCYGGLPSPLRSDAAASLKRLHGSEPGTLEVPAVGSIFPSLPCPPLCAVGAPPVLSPQGLGPSLGLPFSSPRQCQALWGREGAPAISQAGPRGMCRFILLWRTGGPEIRPFLLFVFYFETVFNAFI